MFLIKKVAKNIKLKLSPLFKNKKTKSLTITSFILLIILIFIYFFRGIFVVALVNNKPITRYSLIKQLEKESGKATLDNLIVKELILQEAASRGVFLRNTDIENDINKITELRESQGTSLEVALDMQGQTIEDLKDNIRIQKTAEKLLKDEIAVSDEEIIKFFEDNKEYYEDMEFENLKEDIREQLSQEKLQQNFSELLENLKENSNTISLVDL